MPSASFAAATWGQGSGGRYLPPGRSFALSPCRRGQGAFPRREALPGTGGGLSSDRVAAAGKAVPSEALQGIRSEGITPATRALLSLSRVAGLGGRSSPFLSLRYRGASAAFERSL
jgi:hypothetical protein